MSKWGEGAGVPMEQCADPNRPSYDPATCQDKTTKALVWLCENAWPRMTEWERRFCLDVYGRSPLTRKVHINVFNMKRKYSRAMLETIEGKVSKALAELEKP